MSPSESPIEFPPTFWSLVEDRARRTPDRVLVEDDDGHSMTARELQHRARSVAAALAVRGVGRDSRVCWQLTTSIDALVVMCALARLGAVQIPLIPILRRREVSFIVGEQRPALLITVASHRGFDHAAMAADVAHEVACDLLIVHPGELPERDSGILEPHEIPPDNAERFVFYTSGTTADPKGCRHTDHSAMASANGIITRMRVTDTDCIPVPFPFAHIGGMVFTTTALATGCRLVMVEQFDAARTPLRLAAHGPTLLGSALPFFRAYLAAQRQHGDEPLYPRLRAFTGGGAPKTAEIHAELCEVFGVGLLSGWGLTEMPIATSSSPEDTDAELAETEGRPSPGVEVRVVGPNGCDLPAGLEGELRIRGPQLFLGYSDPRLDDPAFDDQGFLRTGDLGLTGPGGHVQVTGRIKDVIIRNAENISAYEVEGVLLRHPEVADVAVVGVPDPRTGEQAVAVIVLAGSATSVDLADLAKHCRAHGLATQKVPEDLLIVDSLPRNGLGKVIKTDLRHAILRRRATGSVSGAQRDEPPKGEKRS
jgi:cyclohexanecarboxylate-CoA ligase